MDFKIKFSLFIIIQIIKVNSINYFSIKLVDENQTPGTYIRPAISENGYLYIVTGEDGYINDAMHRFIIVYDLNTARFIKKISYKSSYGFWRGEPYVVGDNSDYLFITTYDENLYYPESYASYEFFGINNNFLSQIKDNSIHGYRRAFKKVGAYYYLMYIDTKNDQEGYFLVIRKMSFAYKNNVPSFQNLKINNEAKVRYQAMISCDSTKDNNYIICAYFSGEPELPFVSISAYNINLDLLLTRTFEQVGYFDSDNFIKIVYFKDNSNFILMNSQERTVTRLKYFKYSNYNIIDKLSAITKNSYLDIYNTQHYGHNGENDLIAYDTDKIIKVHGNANSNDIIITIIQFYNNDSSMSIKIYQMTNGNGFMYICQTRITMLKNSLVFCASATKNEVHRGGYFMLNFPNSTDINLESNTILIENLITLENKLFSVNIKFKVLSIPSDFIIISKNKLNSIKVNDELEQDDQLTLRQFRINEGSFILKYQSIARGTDSGYTYIKTYPTNLILDDNEVYLEGRTGQIIINFKDCLNGYYHLEYDMNLCTNEKPYGYYLDIKTKIYKKCPSSCEECDAPINSNYMNCKSCKQGYYMTEDTFSCYNSVPNNYYKDGNYLRRCHKECLYCSTGSQDDNNMKCTDCYQNYFLTEDTNSCYNYIKDNYYKDGNKLRRCYKDCLHCTTGSQDDNNMKCTDCYQNYFLTEDTNSCYNYIKDNYYKDGNKLRRCHKKCLHCSTKAENYTFMNCKECYKGFYKTKDTNSCYDEVIDQYYLDNQGELNRCNDNCLHCTTNENNDNYMNCTRCINNLYMTEDTNSCYKNGIDNYYLDIDNILRRCNKNCLKCSSKETNETHLNCLSCQKNLYLTEDTNSCFEEGLDNYYLDNETNILRKCHPNCLQCYSKPKDSEHMRCKKCKNNYYMTEDSESCYENEVYNYFLDKDILRRCHPNCLQCSSSPNNDNDMNCKTCQNNFYITEDTNSCYDYIPNNYYLDEGKLKKCFARCSNCLGAKNNKTMNCLGCINNDYFYKNDTYDCILEGDFEKRNNLEFSRISDYNFYIFICIFLVSLIIVALIWIIYKVEKNQKNKKEEKKEEIKENIIEIKDRFYENAINDG